MIEKIKTYAPYVIILLLILWSMYQCSSSKSEVKSIHNTYRFKEAMYNNNETTIKRSIDKLGRTVTTQQLLLVTKSEENEMLIIENRELKNVKSETRIKTITQVDSIFIPFISIVPDTASGTEVKIFKVVEKWYGVSGKVLNNGVLIDSMNFNNELVITIGEKKTGFLKKRIPVVEVINKNPYSNTDELYNVVIKPRKKKFFEKRAFQIGVGVVFGTYIGIKLAK